MEGFLSIFNNGNFLAYLGVAIAVLLSGIGSAKGVGIVGEAGSGVLAENPDLFGRLLPLHVIPGTQGLYGFIVGFIIMNKTGMLDFQNGIVNLSLATGAYLLAAALPIGFVGMLSAIAQGRVAATGVVLVAKRPDQVSKALTAAALVEFYAVLALLISILCVFAIPVQTVV